jgi:hypothetical protein
MTSWFWIEVLVAVVLAVAVILLTNEYYRGKANRTLDVEFLRTPTTNILAVLGLLLPLLIALAAYFYKEAPDLKYPSLLASIVLMFLVIVAAVWHSYALLSADSTDSKVTITIPKDLQFISTIGVMYIWLILSLTYIGIFFVRELPVPTSHSLRRTQGSEYFIGKPYVSINERKDAILRTWGVPTTDSAGVLYYISPISTIRMSFDSSGTLLSITEARKTP